MIRLRLRITRSAGKEKSTSMPSPSRLKSSSTFNSRNARPSIARQCMFTCMRGAETIRHEIPSQRMRAFTCRVIGGRITFFQGLPSATRLACSSRHTLFGENAPLGPFLIPPTLETPVLVFKGLHLANHRRIYYPAGDCIAICREGIPPYFDRHL